MIPSSSSSFGSRSSSSSRSNQYNNNNGTTLCNYKQAIRDDVIRSLFREYLQKEYKQEPLEFIDKLAHYKAMHQFVNNSLMSNNKTTSNHSTLKRTFGKGSQKKKNKHDWIYSDSSVFIYPDDLNTRLSLQKSFQEFVFAHPNMEGIIKILFKEVIELFEFAAESLNQDYSEKEPSLHVFVELFLLLKKNDLLLAGQEEQVLSRIVNRFKLLKDFYEATSKQMLGACDSDHHQPRTTTPPMSATGTKESSSDILQQDPASSSSNHHQNSHKVILLGEIFGKLNPIHLFGSLAIRVHYELAMEFHHHFTVIHGEDLAKYIEKKGNDFKESLLGRRGLDLRLQESDLRNPKFTDRHIHLGYALEEDSEHWVQLQLDPNDDGLKCYISKKNYVLDPSRNLKGMKLVKMVIEFDLPLKDVWALYWSGDDHVILDSQAFAENYCVHYERPSTVKVSGDGSHRFGFVLGRSIIDTTIPVLQKRCFSYSMTTVRDFDLNGCEIIMNLGHSVNPDIIDGHLSENERKKHKNCALTTGLFYHIFFGVAERKTKYVHICYLDMDIPLLSGKIFRSIWKRRVKMYKKTYYDLLMQKTNNGKKSVDTSKFKDTLLFRQPIDDMFVTPTWYYDFKHGIEAVYDIENYNVKLSPEKRRSLEEATEISDDY